MSEYYTLFYNIRPYTFGLNSIKTPVCTVVLNIPVDAVKLFNQLLLK